MPVLDQLEPKSVFHFFEEICAIPHGSRHNTEISRYLTEFAKNHSFRYVQDEAQNVIIYKPAAAGYEKTDPVILQGHMDMVCEKNPDCSKDMLREGLELAVSGDTVFAKDTTLGGDDGIGVAMILAILDANNLAHPPIEAVFTTDEEVGMDGAMALDTACLHGRRMINLDSEDEGIFTVSCAGGATAKCIIPVKHIPFSGTSVTIRLSGLTGGHSGQEIQKGRANADMLMGRILYALSQKTDFRLVYVSGGLKDNAIPVSCEAVLSAADPDIVASFCREIEKVLRKEYAATDPQLLLDVSFGGAGETMDEESTQHVIAFLTCAPNGVLVMSHDIDGLVQTSLNLGILATEQNEVNAVFCVRSSVESQKIMLLQHLECLLHQLGGKLQVLSSYPGWEYRRDSTLRDLMTDTFKAQYGYEPKIEAIHAGLECGIFYSRIPDLDCVSIGPDLKEIHTPRETMIISSVQRTWKLLTAVLGRMK